MLGIYLWVRNQSRWVNILEVKEDADVEEVEDPEDGEEPEPPRVINNILKPGTAILLEAEQSYMQAFIDKLS